MQNILYLDDYINIYNKNYKKIISIKPYKETLKKGLVIDREKFLKCFNKIREKYKLNKGIFGEEINVLINSSYTKEDRLLLINILEELNYKKINLINEIKLIKIDKNTMYINYNYGYYYMYYVNEFGNIEMISYENNDINKLLIESILKIIYKKNIIVIGRNKEEIINILDKTNYNYYYYEDSDNLLIKILLNNFSV